MKSFRSIRASFKAYVVISLFLFHFAQGSLNEALNKELSDIFSINIDDSATTKTLQDVGVELFKSISFKRPFDDSVDTFDFIKKIQAMNTSLAINKPIPYKQTLKNRSILARNSQKPP